MKHLQVIVNGVEYVNGEYEELSFADGPWGVQVQAKPKDAPPPPPQQPSGLASSVMEMLETMLTGASKSRTQDKIDALTQDYSI